MCLVDTRNSTHAQADRCPNLCATHRQYNFNIRGDTPGNETIVGQLTQPDSNPANDWDDAVVTTFVTCASPFGLLAARPNCPAGQAYLGTSVDNTQLSSATQAAFNAACCVSAAPLLNTPACVRVRP